MYLSAGHSNTDPGAVAFRRREADIAVEFRNIISFYLMRDMVPHELDGYGTVNFPLSKAVQVARHHDLALEFHCNASSSPQATGTEVLCGPQNTIIGADISRAISTQLGIRNRGVKPENAGQHHRLAFVQAGGLIVELFFLTNPDDLYAYDTRKWLAAREVARVLKASGRR